MKNDKLLKVKARRQKSLFDVFIVNMTSKIIKYTSNHKALAVEKTFKKWVTLLYSYGQRSHNDIAPTCM